jgi:hypothetical protein
MFLRVFGDPVNRSNVKEFKKHIGRRLFLAVPAQV